MEFSLTLYRCVDARGWQA